MTRHDTDHFTISTSLMPSPMSASLNAWVEIPEARELTALLSLRE